MSDIEQDERERSEQGWELSRQLFVLLRTARTHGPNNEAWGPGLEGIREAVEKTQGATIKAADNVMFIDDIRIRVERENVPVLLGLADTMAAHGVGSVELSAEFNQNDLKSLLIAWGGATPESPEVAFADLLAQANDLPGIHLTQSSGPKATPPSGPREQAKHVYASTLSAVEEVMTSVKVSQTLPLKRSKRAVQRLVDQLLADDTNLMGLTTLRCYDEYTYHHSVNVCVLSLALGRRMGLGKPMLAQLGMSSLFHDMGKHRIPVEVLNKPGEFTEPEWEIIRSHPVEGVKSLVKMKGADELAARVVTGSFEHHMGYDHSGYPKLNKPRTLSLYGRIISLADCYDAMTSKRVYNRTAIPPDRALKFMLNKSGKAFDPVLIKVFVNTVGIFPISTLVMLDTGELAVVTAASADPAMGDRPRVRLISGKNGVELVGDGEELELTDKNPGGSEFSRNIDRILDPEAYGIDVSQYFL